MDLYKLNVGEYDWKNGRWMLWATEGKDPLYLQGVSSGFFFPSFFLRIFFKFHRCKLNGSADTGANTVKFNGLYTQLSKSL